MKIRRYTVADNAALAGLWLDASRGVHDFLGETELHRQLSGIVQHASDTVQGAVSVALARDGIADAAFAKSAAGAATQAIHQAALATAVDADDDHGFLAKFRLYSAGHWPLGVCGGSFLIL